MTTRILPVEEWPRLQGTELETLAGALSPDETRIVVVERDGEIVACWAVARMVHLEGLWITPALRKSGSVGRRLLVAAQRELRGFGARYAVTSATTDDVRALILKAGGQLLPGSTYVLPVPHKEIEPCLR